MPLFRVVKCKKVGYINSRGRLIIPHSFDLDYNYLWDFKEGVAPVQIGRTWGYIDSKGTFVIPAKFEWVSPFSEGRALVRLGSEGPPFRIGFIDTTGSFIGEPNLNGAAMPFSEGVAAVQLQDGKWGYIDRSGTTTIGPHFAWAHQFSDGLARVIEKGGCEVYEDECDWMDVPADPSERTQTCNKKDPLPACRFSYIDKSGRTVYSGFQNGQEFAEGFAAVRTSRLWGFMARDGSMVVPERFQSVRPFQEGLAAVRLNDKWGFVDSTGRMVITPQFDNAEGFSEGVGLVWQNQRYLFITKSGEQLFGRTFSIAAPFASGLAHVDLGERHKGPWAYINHQGAVVYKYSAWE